MRRLRLGWTGQKIGLWPRVLRCFGLFLLKFKALSEKRTERNAVNVELDDEWSCVESELRRVVGTNFLPFGLIFL